jgi:hypothetical protein
MEVYITSPSAVLRGLGVIGLDLLTDLVVTIAKFRMLGMCSSIKELINIGIIKNMNRIEIKTILTMSSP